MISEAERPATPALQLPAGPVLWITGLSGVGKSSLAQALVARLHKQGLRPLLLDGDALRDALESPPVSHSLANRERRAWRIARFARLAAQQGIPVVVATISLFHAVQQWNRAGGLVYAEVWLQADFELLRQRNPILYGTPGKPGLQDVVGVDLPAEFPCQAELVLQQCFSADSQAKHLDRLLAFWQTLSNAEPAL